MTSKIPELYVIVGPTAVGKSDYAVSLAKKIGGEVVSADSRQVYRGLDIATGKITKREMKGVPHHMLDVADPKRQYTALRYKRDAEKIIQDIVKRGRVPIICGGTGFYIAALLGEIEMSGVKPNKELRKKLSRKSAVELFAMLQEMDPLRAETIDAKNPVRLIRAIEIAQVPRGTAPVAHKVPSYKVIKLGLTLPKETLRERIHVRLFKRMKRGMIAEAKRLHDEGLSYKRMVELGLEYRYLARYLKNEVSKEEMLTQLETEIWHYAKRQMTWFKRDKEITWLTP